ncbi:uncharacterized protein LOC102718982 isoform X2 [Oryza brachyantha]|uniref:uncharacterized protein LOC102718982 isoform X2 n=1 Tax=Oryza brachyantha TaxID=4533 RepID=UPI000776618A|nr:uncharacterized protein LOC102718982 isoform X2 [Oryza brachyantha]
MPIVRRQQLRLKRVAGLIAREKLSLVMPSFKSLSHQEKWKLFDKHVLPYLEFPPEMKALGFKQVMKTTARAWTTHKSNLVCKFVAKGLQPFDKHPYIEPEDWNEFAQWKLSEESIEDSERYKRLREKNVHDHNMGPAGYDGKIAQWEAEDSLLTSEGIENPWQQYPDDRCRNFLRGRSKLEVVDGVAQIRWSKRATKKVSEDIKEKYASAKSSGVSWVRENDLLTACLGPEQPGCVRGVSSYRGWKHAWPEFANLYKKRRRIISDDELVAIKNELKVEVARDIISFFESQGFQLKQISRNPSPASGRKCSK